MQVGRGGKVVGVDMGFDNPLHPQAFAADIGDDLIRRAHIGTARRVVEIKDGIDDGAGIACRVPHHITEGVGRFVKEMLNDRIGHGTYLFPGRNSNLILRLYQKEI